MQGSLIGPIRIGTGAGAPATPGGTAVLGPFARSFDLRIPRPTNGTITNNNRVFFKADASSPETPFTGGAIVRLHRYVGAACVWEGVSDSSGFYWPKGLEVGVEYYAVAIDPTRTHQVTAAGPVIAVKAD